MIGNLALKTTYNGFISAYRHSDFKRSMDVLIRQSRLEKVEFTVIIIDIDHFKEYNTKYGYHAADLLLEGVGKALQSIVSENELVYRYGYDEFALIVTTNDEKGIMKLCEEVNRHISKEIKFSWFKDQCRVSLGVAFFPKHGTTIDDLMRHAEFALTQAKQNHIHKSKVYRDIFEILKENHEAYDNTLLTTIKVLLTIIDAKDEYTLGHSYRVAEYSLMLGKRMGLTSDELRILKLGALLHDIGKIEIEEEILKKKDILTAEEMKKINNHPLLGYTMIKALDHLSIHRDVVLYHHERLDGSGYPHGLKGEEIPLLARIVAIADSFDAMTSDRPYIQRKTLKDAVEELRKCAGTLFDKELIREFINGVLIR